MIVMPPPRTAALCLCVYESSIYLNRVFEVIDQVVDCFEKCTVFFAFDESMDNSLGMLKLFCSTRPHATIIKGGGTQHGMRNKVLSIAAARNSCLETVRSMTSTPDVLIMMDANYSVQTLFNPGVLKRHLARHDEWDALSFYRDKYYDQWALALGKHQLSIWHIVPRVHTRYRQGLVQELRDKLASVPEGDYIDVESAFCGFGVYRTSMFLQHDYCCKIQPSLYPGSMVEKYVRAGLLTPDWKEKIDCEHRNFHLVACRVGGARIKMANEKLFEPDPDGAETEKHGIW